MQCMKKKVQGDTFNVFFCPTKSQKHKYCILKQEKAANPHLGEAAATACLVVLLDE